MEIGDVPISRRVGQDLTKVPAFTLGPITIDPPGRQLAAGAQADTIEPRVMRVLVALGMSPGRVFSREELIEQCWDGLIVGDNAIDRAISRIRRLLERLGDGMVRLETVTKVGFRIVVDASGQTGNDIPAAAASSMAAKAAATVAPPRKWTRRAAIAGAVLTGTALGAEYLTRSTPAPHTPAPQAQDLLRRGLAEAGQATPGALGRAIGLFRRAVAVDPLYADAWAALAAAYRDSANPFVRRPRSTRERLADWAARRALALEPDHPEAQAVLLSYYPSFGRWAEQEARLRAMELRYPDNWRTNHTLARLLFNVGRFAEALPYAHRVIQLNMQFTLGWITLARIQHSAGRDGEADMTLAGASSNWPRDPGITLARFSTYIGSKRYAEAADWIRDEDRRPAFMSREQAESLAVLADALAQGRGPELLERNRFMPGGFNDGLLLVPGATWLARLGAWDIVFERLEAYYLGGEISSAFVAGSRVSMPPPGSLDERETAILFAPAMLEKRDDARHVGLLRHIGLEDYWRNTRTQPDFRRGEAVG